MSSAENTLGASREASLSRLRAKSARSRLRFLWGLRGVAVFAHLLVFASAWSLGQHIPAVIWLAITLPLGLSRLWNLFADQPRPGWLVWGIELVFAHLIGALLALILLPVAALIAWGAGLLAAAPLVAYLLGVTVAGYGVFIRRRWIVVRELEVPCEELPSALDGFRVAHLSDLHIGSFDPLSVGLRWADRVNALEPDLVAVTGDLVTSGTWGYPDAAEVLGRVSARYGVFVILGNHDQWNAEKFRTELATREVCVLNNAWQAVEVSPGEQLLVAGLGDPYTQSADLDRTLAERPEGFTLLLAHYPSWAERARDRGVGLVLSGHTHGGQVGVPFLSQRLNVARVMGQRSRGLFRLGSMQLYVSAGLGTSGLPIRLGVPPEIVILRLKRVEAR
ncbi:MAG: metallophosphoesterase [Polyangiaceae bacterium]